MTNIFASNRSSSSPRISKTDPPLHISVNQSHRTGVPFPSRDVVVGDGEDDCASDDEAVPVHGRERDRGGDREEDEEVDEEQVEDGADVDGQAVAAQTPAARWERWTADSAENHATDGDDVSRE